MTKKEDEVKASWVALAGKIAVAKANEIPRP